MTSPRRLRKWPISGFADAQRPRIARATLDAAVLQTILDPIFGQTQDSRGKGSRKSLVLPDLVTLACAGFRTARMTVKRGECRGLRFLLDLLELFLVSARQLAAVTLGEFAAVGCDLAILLVGIGLAPFPAFPGHFALRAVLGLARFRAFCWWLVAHEPRVADNAR